MSLDRRGPNSAEPRFSVLFDGLAGTYLIQRFSEFDPKNPGQRSLIQDPVMDFTPKMVVSLSLMDQELS
uniref:Uncharacterized protein n=1 Tax=Romanomermis culicivorax TaxID=13658 RepID=A0A915ICR5_ROMCU